MTIPYDYDQTNIDHLRAVIDEQEQTIEYLHERCKAEEAENARLRDLMYDRAHDYAIQHMTEDELRITAENALDENRKLRELLDYALPIAMYAASTEEGDRIRELMREVEL